MHGFVILQVSLGKCNELLAADFNADKLPADCQSVKGLGRVAPDGKDTYTMQVIYYFPAIELSTCDFVFVCMSLCLMVR